MNYLSLSSPLAGWSDGASLSLVHNTAFMASATSVYAAGDTGIELLSIPSVDEACYSDQRVQTLSSLTTYNPLFVNVVLLTTLSGHQ